MASASDVAADLETIKQKFVGKWKLTKSEGLDEYLKFLGLNFVFRKFAAAASCTVEISVEEDKICLITHGPKTSTEVFSLNTEWELKDPVGNDITILNQSIMISRGTEELRKSIEMSLNIAGKFPLKFPRVMAIVTFEGGMLVNNSKPRGNSKAKKTKATREICVGAAGKVEMVMTVNAEALVMKRYFDKQP